ncbi:MAG: hypothetical protein ABEJ59_04310 [Halanaeroarchaeum sp.]
MDRAVPALLAALLVVATTAPALAVAPSPSTARTPIDGISANTTDVLVLDSVQASTFDQADLVVTAAIDADAGELAATYETYRVQAAYDAAKTDRERERVLENASQWLRTQTETLMAAERHARSRYATGETAARSYLATLGRLQLRADHLETTIDRVDALRARTDAPIDVDALRPDLQTLQGPIRQRLAAAVRGEGASGRTFVAVSPRGVVLAQERAGTYTRETVRLDNRDAAVGHLGFDAAEQRFADLYPWASAHKQRISMGALGPDVFVVELTHTHGTVDAALDASTNQVFREVQTKRLADTPVDVGWNVTANETTLSVSRTYPGGPLHVAVLNATGAPVQANVVVNGTAVGSTGADGSLWTISPAGPYNVTAETADERLRVLVDPATEG